MKLQKKKKIHHAFCIYADSETDSNMLYATRFFSPDPFFWWKRQGKTHVAISKLEIDRAKKNASVDCVFCFEDFKKKNKQTAGKLALSIFKKHDIRAISVPYNFPHGLASYLKKKGIKVEIADSPFFPEREIKTDQEVEHITSTLRKTEIGLARGVEILRASKISRNKRLRWGNAWLTSEVLRREIDLTIMKLGAIPKNTIVAGGDQACDPHERGHGFLYGHQAIVFDIFPHDPLSGYFADMSRTFVRGKASPALKKLYATVQNGKAWVIKQLRSGANGAEIHEKLVRFFTEEGYPTEQRDDKWVGFFHGVGHGVGLDIHEFPNFSQGKFREGHVITVEPGLYYPGVGGVRLEDMVLVRKGGMKNLTQSKEFLEIT